MENSAKSCIRACEATRNCILPQLKHEGEGEGVYMRILQRATEEIQATSSLVVLHSLLAVWVRVWLS